MVWIILFTLFCLLYMKSASKCIDLQSYRALETCNLSYSGLFSYCRSDIDYRKTVLLYFPYCTIILIQCKYAHVVVYIVVPSSFCSSSLSKYKYNCCCYLRVSTLYLFFSASTCFCTNESLETIPGFLESDLLVLCSINNENKRWYSVNTLRCAAQSACVCLKRRCGTFYLHRSL